jgi:hypothetical protein
MDANRFDSLSRHLGSVETRRGLLRLVTALPLAGVLTGLDLEEGQTRRKRHGRRASHRPGHAKANRKGLRKGRGSGGNQSNDGPPPGSMDCPGGVVINGGCFHISDRQWCTCPSPPVPCHGCIECDGCFSKVDGTEEAVCGALTETHCVNSEDCPTGQACFHGDSYRCIIAACYRPG